MHPTGHPHQRWETRPDNERWTNWSIDPREGVIQGPLDLVSWNGRGINLVLDEEQIALLSVRGELRLCLLPGMHTLPVGADDGLPADGLLYFMHLDRALRVAWRQFLPMLPSQGAAPGPQLAHGIFEMVVTQPSSFYEAFLRDRIGAGEDICRDTLTQLLPTFLAIQMTRTTADPADPCSRRDRLAARASQLPQDCLDDDLRPYGLRCVSWSVDNVIDAADPIPERESSLT